MQKLLALTDTEKEKLKILFLAKHAPSNNSTRPERLDKKFGIEPFYNFEIYSILRNLSLDVTPCSDIELFTGLNSRYNYAFTLYNRVPMRNGELFVSTYCEHKNIPYLGAPPNIRALAEDKHLTKMMARGLGISTALWCVSDSNQSLPSVPPFSGPYFVKPRFGAASEGIEINSIQDTWAGVGRLTRSFLDQNVDCIIEQCISGTDITVPVIGGAPPFILECLEETSELPHGIATHRQKRLLDGGRIRTVLKHQATREQICKSVQSLCQQIAPFDYARFDFRQDAATGNVFLLEFNIGCNLGSHAAIAMAALQQDVSHERLIEHILAYSIRRQKIVA